MSIRSGKHGRNADRRDSRNTDCRDRENRTGENGNSDSAVSGRSARKLSSVILQFLFLAAAISLFTYLFLYTTAVSIGDRYLLYRGTVLTEMQDLTFHMWIRNLCAAASILLFTVLFLFLLGQRLSYLLTILGGIEKLRERRMDYTIPVEGDDQLAQLAEGINYLAAAEREITRREEALKNEREAWIRSLSHDIRTPLTSMLSYSEFLMGKDRLSEEEIRAYLELVYAKGLQIRELSTRLLDQETGKAEQVDDMRLLMSQLSQEWLEILEDRFDARADLEGMESFPGNADIYALRRIFDNLASNVEKYADPSVPVTLRICSEDGRIVLTQENGRDLSPAAASAESRRIGLENIRRIAARFGGDAEVLQSDSIFRIRITLSF